MKRSCGIAVGLVVCLLCVSIGVGNAGDEKFSLVVREGFGSIGIGDLNSVLKSTNNDAVYEYLRENYPQCCVGNIQEIPNDFKNWEAELQWNLWRRFSVGVAFEDKAKYDGKSFLTYTILGSVGPETINYTYHSRISVCAPIKFNLYYSLPINSKANIILNAGTGYYCTKLLYSVFYQFRYPLNSMELYSDQFDVKGNQVGFHCGFALEYKVSSRMFLLVESHWRFAKIRTLTGSCLSSDQYFDAEGYLIDESEVLMPHGTLLHYIGTNLYTGARIEKLAVSNSDPSSIGGIDDPSDARKATLDLNGFTFRIGLKIGLF